MNKLLIFIDIDGTIYSPKIKEINPDLIEIIKKLQNNDHLVFLATGRASSFIPKGLYPDLFDGYVLSHGNQVIFKNKDIFLNPLPQETLTYLIKKFENLNIDYVCYSKENIYLNDFNSDLFKFLLTQGTDKTNFSEIKTFLPEKIIYRIEAWDKEKLNWNKILEPFKNLKWAKDPESLRIDIYLTNAKKSFGIKKILNLFNSKEYKSICFGNGINDLDMFKLVDFSIAVENSAEELKKEADWITPSVTENGVGQFLTKYII